MNPAKIFALLCVMLVGSVGIAKELIGVPIPDDALPVEQLDHLPKATSQKAPIWPEGFSSRGLEYKAVLIVEADGRVSAVTLVTSHDAKVEQAIREALLQYKFEPGTLRGKAVRFANIVRVKFR
jgi:hypothetical protein